MKNLAGAFSIENSGHAKLMKNPTQKSSKEYDDLRNQYIQILQNKKFKFESDKTDNKRTIDVVKANKMTLQQLKDLIELNKVTESLLQKNNS